MSRHFALPPKQVWIDLTSTIDTDIDTLYALLSDIENWPTWTPGLTSIRRFGKGFMGPGTFFLMTMEAPFIKRLVLPIRVIENNRDRIEWGGGALGSTIRHFLELKAVDAHTTSLRHVEYSTGLLCIGAWPAAGFARHHDMRWSDTIEARFKKG
jgi:hypothetical protein